MSILSQFQVNKKEVGLVESRSNMRLPFDCLLSVSVSESVLLRNSVSSSALSLFLSILPKIDCQTLHHPSLYTAFCDQPVASAGQEVISHLELERMNLNSCLLVRSRAVTSHPLNEILSILLI